MIANIDRSIGRYASERSNRSLARGNVRLIGDAWLSRLASAPALCVIAGLFTILQIHHSLHCGRLSQTPVADDVGYMNDGIWRLDSAREHGWIHLFTDYWRSPPHSPCSTALALTGYWLLGLHDWAPYAINGALVALLLCCTSCLLRGADAGVRLLACAYVLSTPFAGNMVCDFRPDPLWGLATAMAVVLPLRRSLRRSASPAHWVMGGTWFAVALLAKPPTAPLTLVAVMVSWVLSAMCDRVDDPRPMSMWKGAEPYLWGALPVLVLAAPHYLIDARGIYQYIADNSFGPHRALWHHRGGWMSQAEYYLLGEAGRYMLRQQVWIMGGVLSAGFTAIVLQRKTQPSRFRRAVCLAIVAVTCYAFISINPHKNEFLGSAFHGLLLIGTICVFAALVSPRAPLLGGRAGRAALLAVVMTSLAAARFPPSWRHPSDRSADARNAVVLDVARCIVEQLPAGSNLFVTGFGRVNADTLKYLVRKQGKRVNGNDAHRDDDLNMYRAAIHSADVVVAAEAGVAEFNRNLPSYRVLDQSLEIARSDPRLRQIGAVRSSTGKFFYIYARR